MKKMMSTFERETKLKELDEQLDGKKFLGEIVEEMGLEIESNTMIIAPTGSGKTYLVESIMRERFEEGVNDDGKKNLIVVSVNMLKKQYLETYGVAISDEEAEEVVIRTDLHEIVSYSKFGREISFEDSFLDEYADIYCDEIHSLFDYYAFSKSTSKVALGAAIKSLFKTYEDRKVIYMTATPAKFNSFKESNPKFARNVTVYDLLDHPEIRNYAQVEKVPFKIVEQVAYILKSEMKSILSGKKKVMHYTKTIGQAKKAAEMYEREGARVQIIHSVNNKDHKPTKEMLETIDYIVKYERLPDHIDVLVFNSAIREGVNFKDERVRFIVMDTEDETDFIQATGRLRFNCELLIMLDKSHSPKVIILEELLNVKLTEEKRDILVGYLGLTNSKGEVANFQKTAKKIIEAAGYEVEIKRDQSKEGKGKTITTITKK